MHEFQLLIHLSRCAVFWGLLCHTITASITNSLSLTSTRTIDIEIEALSISAVMPSAGDEGGGTSVTITGAGFGSNTTVEFDGNAATNLSLIDIHQITCDTPSGTGTVDVEVIDGVNSDSLTNGYTFQTGASPVVSITSPNNLDSFGSGVTINFAGTATDSEDGDISSSLSWLGSKDGGGPTSIGSGASFSTILADGNWAIIATVTDSDSNVGGDVIFISVG